MNPNYFSAGGVVNHTYIRAGLSQHHGIPILGLLDPKVDSRSKELRPNLWVPKGNSHSEA